MLSLSLLLHAALLFLPLAGPRFESPRRDSPTMVVDLVPRPGEREAESTARPSEPERPPPREKRQTQEPQAPESADTAQPQLVPSTPAKLLSAPNPPGAAATAGRIQAQLLNTARTLGRESEQVEKGAGLRYNQAPSLPSQPGWLHQHTGRVSPSIDRWKGNDGSRSARVVTGNGQVLCIRTRAPTTAEIFNPWMSAAVPMMSSCGRERPEGVDREDPWLRSPGKGQ